MLLPPVSVDPEGVALKAGVTIKALDDVAESE
jgi:hypothetical protein